MLCKQSFTPPARLPRLHQNVTRRKRYTSTTSSHDKLLCKKAPALQKRRSILPKTARGCLCRGVIEQTATHAILSPHEMHLSVCSCIYRVTARSPECPAGDATIAPPSTSAATNMYSITFLPLQPSKSSILRRRWTPYLYPPADENLIRRAVDGTLRLQHHRCLQPRTCAASNFCRCNPPKVASSVVDGYHVYILQPMKT